MPDGLPLILNFLHQCGCNLKIFTVFIVFGYFYKLAFLLQIFVLFFLLILVETIFLHVKVTRSLLKNFPNFFVVCTWYSSNFKILFTQFLKSFDSILPPLMTGLGFRSNLVYFFNQLFFLFVIVLEGFLKFLELRLASVVDQLRGLTEFVPYLIAIFLGYRSNFFFPHFVEHLEFAEGFVYIFFLGKFLRSRNQLEFVVEIVLKI